MDMQNNEIVHFKLISGTSQLKILECRWFINRSDVLIGYFFLVLPQSGSKLVLASTQQLISLRWIWEKALWSSVISNLVPRFTGRHRPHVSLQTYLYLTPFWVTRKAGSACYDIPSYCTSFFLFSVSSKPHFLHLLQKCLCFWGSKIFYWASLSPTETLTLFVSNDLTNCKKLSRKFFESHTFPFQNSLFFGGGRCKKDYWTR